jgi:prepilin-type N-terminal cleavage/methylation domain-containing protein
MKRGFTIVEVLIVIFIIGILAPIAIPQFDYLMCKNKCAQGDCSDRCRRVLANPSGPAAQTANTESVLKRYDKQDVEVFCKMYGVSLDDFVNSKSLQDYYKKFKDGTLNLQKGADLDQK